MLFDKILERVKEMEKKENQKGDFAPLQYADGGVEIEVTKNGKTKTLKENR
jgi:hypothetical protein